MDPRPENLPISLQATLLGLNRTSLYYRPVGPDPEEVAFKHRIDELYTAYPFYGSRRITAQLVDDGHPMNRKRIQRYMREMGIWGIAPGPHTSTAHPDHLKYPYLLNGITAGYPNHIWGSDITYGTPSEY